MEAAAFKAFASGDVLGADGVVRAEGAGEKRRQRSLDELDKVEFPSRQSLRVVRGSGVTRMSLANF